MEQRLRLVQGAHPKQQRSSERHAIAVPGQLIWKDAKGTTRMASVVTRNVSEHGVLLECLSGGSPIPLYRLVYLQIDRSARESRDLPDALRKNNILAAVFRVGPCSPVTGAPTEYALRLLVEPTRDAASSALPGRQTRVRAMTA
jgi:hypothetical protein